MLRSTTRIAVATLAISLTSFAAYAAELPPPDQVIAVSGSRTMIHTWNSVATDPGSSPQSYYSIALDGKTFTAPRPTSYDLKLRYGRFDPLTESAPSIPTDLAARSGEEVYIVQFQTQPLEAYRENLRAAGAEVFFYLADHAHLVRMSSDVAERVGAMPFVRWVGTLDPVYRTEEFLIDRLLLGDAENVQQTYNVMLFESEISAKHRLAEAIESLGGEVAKVNDGKYLLRAVLTTAQLRDVIRLNDVLFVDRWSPLQADMDVVREIGGANFLEFNTPEGFDGEGVRGEIFDLGFNLIHTDFASRPQIEHGAPVDEDSHGSACAGINFGDGTSDPDARGLMPAGQAIVADSDLGLTGPSRYDHTGELLEAPFFASFQTASVGSNRTFFYTTISADHDALLFDWDIVHCQSQSNAGDQDSRPQAWAKNVISGGGVFHQNTLDRSDDQWNFGASIGPADDGRIKPDLAHFYDNVLTTSCGFFGGCTPTDYTQFSGTSSATPIICGHVGLFLDMWADGTFGNPVDGTGEAFSNRPHMTTSKAAVINTASQWDWLAGGPNSDIDRFKQGWGMPDVERLYERRNEMYFIDETDVLGNMESTTHVLNVAPGETELKATLVFADPPGIPNSNQHRVNDLSLEVTSPSGTTYWGNNGLTSGMWSTPGGNANTIDTVENVFIASPEPGDWSVRVVATEVIQDSHVETGAIDADYALVVSGAVGEAVEPPLLSGPTPGIAGVDNTFTATGATPGANIQFVFGQAAGTTPIPGCTGSLPIDGARSLGSAIADGSGTATLTTFIPAGASGRTGFFAVVDTTTCTASDATTFLFP